MKMVMTSWISWIVSGTITGSQTILPESLLCEHLDSILKTRDITLLTNVQIVKAMVFPVVMYGFESWTIKKAEHWRIDAFELWCWRRLLRVPWTARRSNQSILKEISPGCSLEGLMLKLSSNTLAAWCKELPHWKRPCCWERLKAGEEGDDRRWDGWIANLMDMNLSKLQELMMDRETSSAIVHGVTESDRTEWLNWTGASWQIKIGLLSRHLKTFVFSHIKFLNVRI